MRGDQRNVRALEKVPGRVAATAPLCAWTQSRREKDCLTPPRSA